METILLTIAESIGRHIWIMSWHVTVLGALIWLLDRFMSGAAPAYRHLLWCIVLARLLFPAQMPASLPAPGFIGEPLGTKVSRGLSRLPVTFEFHDISPTPLSGTMTGGASSRKAFPPSGQYINLFTLAGAVWSIIAAVMAILVLLAARNRNRLIADCGPVGRPSLMELLNRHRSGLGIRSRVRLCQAPDRMDVEPCVGGVFDPVILLPRRMAETWSEREIEPVIVHELAHIQRRDLLLNWLQIAIQAAFFFHPVIWLANRRIRACREEACDDIAVSRVEGGRGRYGASILRIVEETLSQRPNGFALVSIGERSTSLGKRVKRIMDNKYTPKTRLTVPALLSLALIALKEFALSCEEEPLRESNLTDTARKTAVVDPETMDADRLDHIKHALGDPDYPLKMNFMGSVGIASINASGIETSKRGMEALGNVAEAFKRYSIVGLTPLRTLSLESPVPPDIIALFVSTGEAVRLNGNERDNLLRYLAGGGFLIVNNENPTAAQPIRNSLAGVLGGRGDIRPLSDDNRLFHVFFDFDEGPPSGTVWTSREDNVIDGIYIDGALAGVFWKNDYAGKWLEGAPPQIKFGVNMVVYAFIRNYPDIRRETIETDQPADDFETKKTETPADIRINEGEPIASGSEKVNYQRELLESPDSEVAEKAPDKSKGLKKTNAYLEYEKGYNLFVDARKQNDDLNLYRQAAEIFDTVSQKYPNTDVEIGACSNLGVCYEALEMWQEAVEAYDMVIQRFKEDGEVGQDAFNFANSHKQYIIANKL